MLVSFTLLGCFMFHMVACIRFQPHIETNEGLITDGSYSKLTTLSTRLPFASIPMQYTTKRHLWNYLSILTLALDTLNQADKDNLMHVKLKLTRAIHRLQYMTLPDMKYLITEESFHYQIDFAMLMMVHEHLKAFLVPSHPILEDDSQILDICLQSRHLGTTAMYRSLFQTWDILNNPSSVIIQLLARAYLSNIYILHMTHDGDYLYHQNLFFAIYNLLHQNLATYNYFTLVGTAEQYELALMLADCLCDKKENQE